MIVAAMIRSALTAACDVRLQGWSSRLGWLEGVLKDLHEQVWSPEKTVGVMIDNFMSYGDLRNLRQALSLVYDKNHDRFMHPVWLVSPVEALLTRPLMLRRPEPIRPVEKIRQVYKTYEDDLKITV